MDPNKASLVANWLDQQPQQPLGQHCEDPPSDPSEILSMPSPKQDGEELTPEESDMLNDHFQGTLRGGGNACSVGSRRRRRTGLETISRSRSNCEREEVVGSEAEWKPQGDENDDAECSSSSSSHYRPTTTVVNHTQKSHSHSTYRAAASYARQRPGLVISVTTSIHITTSSTTISPQAGNCGVRTGIWAGNSRVHTN